MIAVLAAALLLASCSKEVGNGGAEPSVPVAPALLGISVAVTPQSRSVVTGTAFKHGSRINIIMQDAGATTIYRGLSQPYEFQKLTDADPGTWVPTAAEGLLVSDPANVYAHYPAVLAVSEAVLSSDKKTLTLALPAARDFGDINTSSSFESFYMKLKADDPDPTEIFVCTDDTDYMTGQGTQVSTLQGGSKQTAVSMQHALAMVIVYVKRAAGTSDLPDVRGITIQNKAGGAAPLKQGSFLLADNSFTANSAEAGYTRTMSGFPVDVVRYALLVYPAAMEKGAAEMILTTDGAAYTMDMPAKTWTSGRVYIYNVEISANEAQIGGVTITDWPEWTDKPFELE